MTYEGIKNSKVIRAICKFQSSCAYVYVLAALAVLSNALALDGFSFVPVLILLCVTNLFSDSVLPAFPAVFTVAFGISPENTPAKGDLSYYLSVPFLCCVAPLVCAVIATAVWRFIKEEGYKNLKFSGGLGLGIALYCAGLLLGGLFSRGYGIADFAISLLVAATLAPFYFFFAATLKKSDLNKEYLCKSLVASGFVAALELAVFYLKNYSPAVPLNTDWKNSIHVGWGISNTIGMYAAFMIPPCFYFALEEGRVLKSFALAGALFVCICFSLCRSGMLFGGAAFAACALICCFRGKNKKTCVICTAACLAACVAGVFFAFRGMSVSQIGKKLFTDNGRFENWSNSLKLFAEYPILGAGFCGYFRAHGGDFFVAFSHNTLVQLLVSCGAVGFCCYLYHRAQTVMLFAYKITPFRCIILVQILAFLCMGLLDIAAMAPYFNMVYAALLAFLEKQSFALAESEGGLNLTPLSVFKRAKKNAARQ